MFRSIFGKYRFLVVSIALFLIFDLGVLTLNFYTSGKIAEQTELINLAARQSTLTQQMSKATLYIKAQKLQQWVYQSGVDELKEHYTIFDETLSAFTGGGLVESVETSLPIEINALTDGDGKAILDEANRLWAGFQVAIAPLMVDTLITDDEIRPASAFIAKHNVDMFNHMNALTTHFTEVAERQTTLLRRAQIIGIGLATINFFVILFHFIRQLRSRERVIQTKQYESDQILSTINEGVFLVGRDLVMSGQYSKHLETVFATQNVSGQRLESFLSNYFPTKTVDTALEFVRLYFLDHIDSSLIADVNPLKKVEANIVLENGELQRKYLDFSFAYLQTDSGKPSLLVTVNDITAGVLLEGKEQESAGELEQKISLITQTLPIPEKELQCFFDESLASFDSINTLLKDTGRVTDSYENTLTRISREAHKLKGNAAALELDWFANRMHQFEDSLEAIRTRSRVSRVSGEDLLPLTMQLKECYDDIEVLSELKKKLLSYGGANNVKPPLNRVENVGSDKQPIENKRWFGLVNYTNRVAAEKDVVVDLKLRGFNKIVPAPLTEKLYPIVVQLVRNSVSHGIESQLTRSNLKKPNHGQISVSLSDDRKGNYRLLFEDDGRGFDYEAIRTDIVKKGLIDEAAAMALGKTGLVRYAFIDSISSHSVVDTVSGRGVGLPLVWEQVRQLNGKLKVRSVQNEFTQFIIDFKYEAQSKDNATIQKAS